MDHPGFVVCALPLGCGENQSRRPDRAGGGRPHPHAPTSHLPGPMGKFWSGKRQFTIPGCGGGFAGQTFT